jgi:hypothetical protein
MVALEEKKEKEAALTETQETLSTMGSKVSRAEEDAQVTRKALERAKEETAQSREQATLAKEVATRHEKRPHVIKVLPPSSTRR